MQPSAARNTPPSKPSKVSAGALCLRSWLPMKATPTAVYTVPFYDAIYVLLVKQRLAAAEQDYRERQN